MKLIIFGATGSVGKELTKQALDLGHMVTAFVRKVPNELSHLQHGNLQFVEGDVLDKAAVISAVEGHESVFCVLGAGKKGNIRSQGTHNIILGMQKWGIKRLICQSTLGAGDSRSNLNFVWKNIMFGWLLKAAYEDHQLQEEHVRNSNLDWILVRPAAFTDGPLTNQFKHGFSTRYRKITLKISRADVASFLLQQLNSNQYLRKTPGLSY